MILKAESEKIESEVEIKKETVEKELLKEQKKQKSHE